MTSKAISLKEFFAVKGTRFSQSDAETIGPVLSRISGGDMIAPRDVLSEARSPISPIHSYFEWNDNVAADLYRVGQAKDMLRSIKVQVVNRPASASQQLVQVSRPITPVAEANARTLNVASRATSQASEMMDRAYQDITQWKRKYESYAGAWKEFGDVFLAVVNQVGEFVEAVQPDKTEAKANAALRDLMAWRARYAGVTSTCAGWDEQMQFMLEAIGDADEKLCSAEDQLPMARCAQCGKPFAPRHERHRLCEAC